MAKVFSAGKHGKIRLTGLEEYADRIKQAGQDVDEVIQEGLGALGDEILADMHRLVPKDTHNLESHLAKELLQDGHVHVLTIGIDASEGAKTFVYGMVQEYGSSSVKAHPYIRPAMERGRKRVMQVIKTRMKARGLL